MPDGLEWITVLIVFIVGYRTYHWIHSTQWLEDISREVYHDHLRQLCEAGPTSVKNLAVIDRLEHHTDPE